MFTRQLCIAFFLIVAAPVFATPLADAENMFNAKRYSEAKSLLEPLAASGVPEAQRMLGEMYYAGNGVPVDKLRAFKLTEAAAQRDDRIAQFSMGYLYEKGEGVAASARLATEYYRKSALQRYPPAMLSLGKLYSTSDFAASRYWYEKASEYGIDEARQQIRRADEAQLARSDKADLQRRQACESSCPLAHQRANCRDGSLEPARCTVEDDPQDSPTRSGVNSSAPSLGQMLTDQAARMRADTARISSSSASPSGSVSPSGSRVQTIICFPGTVPGPNARCGTDKGSNAPGKAMSR